MSGSPSTPSGCSKPHLKYLGNVHNSSNLKPGIIFNYYHFFNRYCLQSGFVQSEKKLKPVGVSRLASLGEIRE